MPPLLFSFPPPLLPRLEILEERSYRSYATHESKRESIEKSRSGSHKKAKRRVETRSGYTMPFRKENGKSQSFVFGIEHGFVAIGRKGKNGSSSQVGNQQNDRKRRFPA